ncbi:hypothetical protein SPRG_03353 [Saprolegnia parasitica CBS 223.65]|uniref:Uncharacterized protein n=1 Tax=Saprolegnia parasitica (strain CBS 223.65) TaxID=695850 RepID=A0A067D063_SAPPC|nr:hypothetical protein SPRG_03353 [Saprolegnia parasitica CBS 223.65]KDO32136.1 hypothetical protein SPRG_03353 [Saprolegnia parasitica CBS 223.65]|eukprot:XP_012197320.1 hypothetical protein SPRG_03353 [Saprolegnia parasitica CBS 223.65]
MMANNPAASVHTPTNDEALITDAPVARHSTRRRGWLLLASLVIVGAVVGAVVYVASPSSSTTTSTSATQLLAADEHSTAVNLPQVIIAALEENKPNLAQLVKDNPCKEMGYLYNEKGSNYKALARWISGLNVIRFEQVELTTSANGTLSLRLKATFPALPASLRIDGCLGSLCSNIADDTKTCCGTEKTVTLVASIGCSESFPFLRNVQFTTATITPIIVTVKALGQTITKDLTPSIEAKFKEVVTGQGLEYANTKLKELFGDAVQCAQ